MQLTLANHPVSEIRFGAPMRLDGTMLVVEPEELRRVVLEDESILGADFEIARPGESCRAGPVFDIIEPRAKEPGSSPNFPGILGPPTTAGSGTTHVLAGAAVSVLAERGPGESRSATGRFLEMSGAAAEATDYSSLQHLVVIFHTRAGLPNQTIEKAYRRAGLKVAVYVASAALNQAPASTQMFDPAGPMEVGRKGLPRVAYIGQIFSRQRKPAADEPILYGANTDGMLPVLLHPDEWLDGAIVPSLRSWIGGTETYYYQNHPVIMELYRRHHAHELNFVGTVATIAGSDNFDRERNCRTAASLVKSALKANSAVLTKYGGGLPHADLAETARLLEGMGIKTAVMVSDTSRDRRVESALLFNFPEVNAIIYNGGNGTEWEVPRVERIIASTPDMRQLLAGPFVAEASNIIGVTNQQGASRMRAMIY
ncbi:MAG TPA: glycine/sarcosine/betaine reductase component B subunit [Candidatus Acidoferrales bacterium]|nr:glycine/sarcosine/betaine reductase component B subunit [Candidatus Acidoferrales bacterium]